jgi:hypothetical protein
MDEWPMDEWPMDEGGCAPGLSITSAANTDGAIEDTTRRNLTVAILASCSSDLLRLPAKPDGVKRLA